MKDAPESMRSPVALLAEAEAYPQAGTACTAPSREAVVAGRQSNHGCFHMPESLSWLDTRPTLWMAVALWGLQKGVQVTRNDIATAFRISPRRAADVMTYLCSSRTDMVTCEKTVSRVSSGHRVAYFLITSVAESLHDAPEQAKERKREGRPACRGRQETDTQSLASARLLFLHGGRARRTG